MKLLLALLALVQSLAGTESDPHGTERKRPIEPTESQIVDPGSVGQLQELVDKLNPPTQVGEVEDPGTVTQ